MCLFVASGPRLRSRALIFFKTSVGLKWDDDSKVIKNIHRGIYYTLIENANEKNAKFNVNSIGVWCENIRKAYKNGVYTSTHYDKELGSGGCLFRGHFLLLDLVQFDFGKTKIHPTFESQNSPFKGDLAPGNELHDMIFSHGTKDH